MQKPRGSRVLVVSVRFVVRTSVRAIHRCRPWLERAADALVEVAATETGGIPAALTRYAIVGGATASAFALARAFAGPGVSELLLVVEAVAVGALAVWIAVRLVQEVSGSNVPHRAKALIVATTTRVAPAHRLPSTRTLQLVCDPRTVLSTVKDPALLGRLLHTLVKKVVMRQAVHALPGLGAAREALGVVVTGVSSARFIHDFETSARELCAAA